MSFTKPERSDIYIFFYVWGLRSCIAALFFFSLWVRTIFNCCTIIILIYSDCCSITFSMILGNCRAVTFKLTAKGRISELTSVKQNYEDVNYVPLLVKLDFFWVCFTLLYLSSWFNFHRTILTWAGN